VKSEEFQTAFLNEYWPSLFWPIGPMKVNDGNFIPLHGQELVEDRLPTPSGTQCSATKGPQNYSRLLR